MIKILDDEHVMVATVAARWKLQYCRKDEWSETHGFSGLAPKDVFDKLSGLPPKATAQDVAAIIGNDLWVGHRCVECKETKTKVIQLGEDPDYESHTVTVCFECAKVWRAVFIAVLP